ncbi:MAG: DVU0772 family protein [Desulfosoma sp.]
MMTENDLKTRKDLLDKIDWDMTPERAIETYLEWGTGWSRKGQSATVPGQESFYFVVYAWEEPAQVTLVRRDSQGMEELAKISVPSSMVQEIVNREGRKPGVGVYALSEELKQWLKTQLGL